MKSRFSPLKYQCNLKVFSFPIFWRENFTWSVLSFMRTNVRKLLIEILQFQLSPFRIKNQSRPIFPRPVIQSKKFKIQGRDQLSKFTDFAQIHISSQGHIMDFIPVSLVLNRIQPDFFVEKIFGILVGILEEFP